MSKSRYIYSEDGEIIGVVGAQAGAGAPDPTDEEEDVCEITSTSGDMGWCETHEQFHALEPSRRRRE